eukprot:3076918-Amphidinium_carterae.1
MNPSELSDLCNRYSSLLCNAHASKVCTVLHMEILHLGDFLSYFGELVIKSGLFKPNQVVYKECPDWFDGQRPKLVLKPRLDRAKLIKLSSALLKLYLAKQSIHLSAPFDVHGAQDPAITM